MTDTAAAGNSDLSAIEALASSTDDLTLSQVNTQRPSDTPTDSLNGTERGESRGNSRPLTGVRPQTTTSTASKPFIPAEDTNAPASDASKAAAAEAQASVAKEGGPPALTGLLSYAPGGVNQNSTVLGLGTAPVVQEVALVTVPRLDDLIIKALADNYHVCPAFDWIPVEYLENVVALLQPGKLDFASSAELVETEKYWQRLACERWERPTLNLADYGQSWKRLYCEKHMKECLEKYHHSKQQHNYKRLLKEIEACKPFVHSLILKELMSHLDLSDLLFDFPNLTSLDLKFGARELGMDYDKSLFGMSLADSLSLSKLMTSTQTINKLILSENLMNDESVLLLLNGLHPSVNHTLTYLDLSHNKISDIGAKKLCCLLDGGVSQDPSLANSTNGPIGSVLMDLYLQDNNIRTAGAIAFGNALANNRGLRRLNLSLNSLQDEGGVALLNGLTQHTTLKDLSLSACDLSFDSSESFLNLLRFNRSLENLNLSCNELHGKTGGVTLFDALKQNDQIISLDLRKNGLAAQVDSEMKALLARRLAAQKQEIRKAFQKDWDAAM